MLLLTIGEGWLAEALQSLYVHSASVVALLRFALSCPVPCLHFTPLSLVSQDRPKILSSHPLGCSKRYFSVSTLFQFLKVVRETKSHFSLRIGKSGTQSEAKIGSWADETETHRARRGKRKRRRRRRRLRQVPVPGRTCRTGVGGGEIVPTSEIVS